MNLDEQVYSSAPPAVLGKESARRNTNVCLKASIRELNLNGTERKIDTVRESISERSTLTVSKQASVKQKEFKYTDPNIAIGKGKYGPVSLIIVDE